MRLPTLKPERPEVGNRFDALWDNLASGIPSSPGVTALTEQPEVRKTLAPSESETSSTSATQMQMPEPTHKPVAPSLSPSTEHIVESEVLVARKSTSSLATKVESAEFRQELTPALLESLPSIEESAQINDLKPAPPPELASELPTGDQTSDEDPQTFVHAATTEADEPPPGASLPPETPRSSLLRAMVGLLRTGLGGFEGYGARR
jgi:hypothetical protein